MDDASFAKLQASVNGSPSDQGSRAMSKAVQNTKQLVETAVRVMKARGMTDEQIIPELPRLAREAVAFLAAKAA
jgi:hypothetical protein